MVSCSVGQIKKLRMPPPPGCSLPVPVLHVSHRARLQQGGAARMMLTHNFSATSPQFVATPFVWFTAHVWLWSIVACRLVTRWLLASLSFSLQAATCTGRSTSTTPTSWWVHFLNLPATNLTLQCLCETIWKTSFSTSGERINVAVISMKITSSS